MRTKGRPQRAAPTEGKFWAGHQVCYGDECKASSAWVLNSVLTGSSPAVAASSGVLEKSGVLASLSRKRSRVQIPYTPLCGCGREEFRRLSSKEVHVGSNPTIRTLRPKH